MFITKVESLVYINYHVTFIFLIIWKKNQKSNLLKVLPPLYYELFYQKFNIW